MRSRIVLASVVLDLALIGCAPYRGYSSTPSSTSSVPYSPAPLPTAEAIAVADFGPVPSKEEAQAAVLAWLRSYLKDPDSAQIEWGEWRKGYAAESILGKRESSFDDFDTGHVLPTRINSKNSYGGYVGYKQFEFVFRNGALVAVYAELIEGSVPYVSKIK